MLKGRRERADKILLDYCKDYDGGIQGLLRDVKSAGGELPFIEGGGLAIYYVDQRAELQAIYNQSDEEASQYSDEQVYDNYKNHMMQAIVRLKKFEQWIAMQQLKKERSL